MKALWAFMTCGVLALPAVAQELGRIDTPSGPAVLSRQDFDAILTIGGQEFRFEGMRFAGFAERLGDVVLLQLSSGGSLCPAMYVWLDTRPGQVRLSDEFGTCSDLHAISWDSEAVTVTLPSMQPGAGFVDFRWDGKTSALREAARAPAASGLPPGHATAAWEGRFGTELLAAPEWQGLLLGLMGRAALDDALRIVQVGHPFGVQGDWLVATGCQPHQCDVTAGAVALHRADGRLIVALWEARSGVRSWGDLSAGIPPGVAQVLAGR